MGTPVKVVLHQDIYEEALKQAGEKGTKVTLYCREIIRSQLDQYKKHSGTSRFHPPKGYEIVHSQTKRAERDKPLETAKVQFRTDFGDYDLLQELEELTGLTPRAMMRNLITNQILNETGNG